MKPELLEKLTKAQQCADLLVRDVKDAHRPACHENPYLGLALESAIKQAKDLRDLLQMMVSLAD